VGWLAGDWRETGLISTPADGPVSWTSRADAAEAAAIILASDGGFDGAVTLTGSSAPDLDDVAGIASELVGHSVGRVVVGDDDWVASQVAAGRPETMARFTLGMYQAAREGFFAGVDPQLARLLGREPRSVREALEAVPTY